MSANYPRATTLVVGDTFGPDYFVTPQFKGKILLSHAELNQYRRKRRQVQSSWHGFFGVDELGNNVDDEDDDDDLDWLEEDFTNLPETAEPFKLKWHHYVLLAVVGIAMAFAIRAFFRRRR